MTFQLNSFFKITTLCLLLGQTSFAKFYRVGAAQDVTAVTQPVLCLAGGGSDDLWVEGWKKLLTATNGGDVVIVRPYASRSSYENWIYNDSGNHGLPKVNSVTTIGLGGAADANSAAAVQAVRNAELIFFDGGDQSVYINLIKGSALQPALEEALARRTPMGGTSAGMAILGGIDFTAKYPVSKKVGTVSSYYAMNYPTAQFVDLDRGLLVPPFLQQVVTDTHFSQRARQGRLVAFMARSVYNNYANSSNIKGIGADEGTAFCYDMTTGIGKVYGANSVHFTIGNANIERIVPGASLDWFSQRQAVNVYSIPAAQNATAGFDLSTWTGVGGQQKYWFVDGSDTANAVFGEN